MQAVHMNPAEAVQAHLDLEASESIGMHFGTFQLTTEGIDEAVARARRGVPRQKHSAVAVQDAWFRGIPAARVVVGVGYLSRRVHAEAAKSAKRAEKTSKEAAAHALPAARAARARRRPEAS